MEQIDIFKLASMLDFDIRQTNLKNSVISIMIIDENYEVIPGFNSNKAIIYNKKKNEEIIKYSIIQHIYNYVKNKDELNNIHLVKVNGQIKQFIDIDILIEICIKKGLINADINIKKII